MGSFWLLCILNSQRSSCNEFMCRIDLCFCSSFICKPISFRMQFSDTDGPCNLRLERINDLANHYIAQQRNYSKIKSFLTVKVASSLCRFFFGSFSPLRGVSTVLWMIIIGNPLNTVHVNGTLVHIETVTECNQWMKRVSAWKSMKARAIKLRRFTFGMVK